MLTLSNFVVFFLAMTEERETFIPVTTVVFVFDM